MTRNRFLVAIAVVVILGLGLLLWLRPWATETASAQAQAEGGKKERKVLYWVDPMNPTRRSDKPGKMADGMDLVPVYEDAGADASMPPGTVKIDAARQQLIGVTYGEVSDEPLFHTIRAVGKVTYDETRIARIHPKIEGWIEQVYVDFTGKQVKKGEALLSVYSPELLSAQQELLIAKRGKDSLGAQPDAEISANALSLYSSSRERLRLWDVSEQQIEEVESSGKVTKALTLYSPISGFVLTRNAYERQRVTAETELYTVADLSTLWVLADIYEYEIPQIRLGQAATVTFLYLPGRRYSGRVTYIYPQLDNATRTLKVRVELPNPNYELKPDMFANVELRSDFGRVLSVPQEAVLDSGAEQVVFVARDGGYFEPRRVQTGAKVDDRVIVLKGLTAGEKIVTSGNFLVDSESRLKSATGAMGAAGHSVEPSPPEAKKQTPADPAAVPGKKFQVVLRTEPEAPSGGAEAGCYVSVADPQGAPVRDAQVTLELLMPAMPEMGMAEMRQSSELKWDGKQYSGRMTIPSAGSWNVTVNVSRGGQRLTVYKTTLLAKQEGAGHGH